MFGIGMQELMIIAIVALIIVGPKKLPDLAKSMGKSYSEFKKATQGVTEDIKKTIKVDIEPKNDDGLRSSFIMNKPDVEETKTGLTDNIFQNK